MKTEKYVDTLDAIIETIPVEVNTIQEINFDREIENKNYKPYVYYDKKRGVLKVFRVNKKNLETLLAAYDYGKLSSSFVNNFDACLYLDKERDGKVIKILPPEAQKQIKTSMFGCAQFKDIEEFMNVFSVIKDKIQWSA
jgi:hypothetical protein